MSTLDWLLLLIMFVLGIVTSYTDIFFGKIRNKHLLMALSFLVLVLPIKFYYGMLSILETKFFLINFILAIILAAGIWLLGFWTPGDGKLFFVFSVFLSSVFPAKNIIGVASIRLLFYVFLPMFLLLVSVSLFKLSLRELKRGLFKSLDWKLIVSALAVFVINWMFVAQVWKGVILFIALFLTYFFVRDYSMYVLAIISILRLLLDPSVFSVSFAKYFLLIFVAIYFLRFFLGEVFYEVFCENIKLNKLKPGMVPAEVVCKRGKQYEKRLLKRAPRKRLGQLFEPRPEGLTKEDIDKLKKRKNSFNFSCIKVFKTLPFAPFMLLGVMVFLVVAIS